MLSNHAEIRIRQRGVKPEVINVLLAYGESRPRRGAEVYFMDRRARERARAGIGESAYRTVADKLNSYLVVSSDGAIVTVAKRRGRLKF